MPIYDFTTYRRTDNTISIDPAPIILVDGILIFTKRKLRDLMDIKIFVDTDSDVRFIRRLERDMNERGRSLDSVVQQYLGTVRPMHLKFVEPSKRYADIIIPGGGHNRVAMEMVVSRLHMLLRAREEHAEEELAS
ncbi:MAG TPA: uridine kinase, partial [Promineifilum sp.]|nr:uridine kinase [Promineifilum sp.]